MRRRARGRYGDQTTFEVGRPKCIEQKFTRAKRGIFLPGSCRFCRLALRRLVLSSRAFSALLAMSAMTAVSALMLRRSETDDLVLFTMIRPEILAIECQRSRMERNSREIFRRSCGWIEASEPIVSGVFVVGSYEVEIAIDDDLAADLVRYFELGQNSAVIVQPQDSLVVPLAQVQVLAIAPEL